jgi:uncharacterized membrane protein
MASEAHEDLDERLIHRLMFFTDAVFAIVMTLLVLELRAPEAAAEATPATFHQLGPHIGAFAFSFAIAAIFWIAHMNTTRNLVRFDWPVAWANLVFLLPVCLLPSATAWFGADIAGAFAWGLYSAVLIAISAANMLVVLVAYRDGGRLIAGGAPPRERAYRLVRAGSPGAAFAIGLLVMAAGFPIVAHYSWVIVLPIFWLARRFLAPRPTPASETA